MSRLGNLFSSRIRTDRREFLRGGGLGIAALALLRAQGKKSVSAGKSSRPSLDLMISQMILAGFRGIAADHTEPPVVDESGRSLGGVVLFDYDQETRQYGRNIQSPEQLAALCKGLQSAASGGPPLFICVDQEGGSVSRLKPKDGFPPSFSQQVLGTERDDLNQTYQSAETAARTLKAAGINLNLAPVVDLNINPYNPVIGALGRSFSADPGAVTAHALQVIQAHHDVGVLTTLKHFPGHGSSTGDSHLGFVDVTAAWSEKELQPFRSIIQAGLCDAVMTAHIFNANLDADYPATLSHATITGVLRQQLGWDGVVITDDLGMGAITQHYGFETAVQLAIQAGADILSFANNSAVFDPTIPTRAYAAIRHLVIHGTISRSRIEESYRRITSLKSRISVL